MRYFSFGGGVQSTAALVLAAQGKLQVDAFLFANVGDDSEHPATLRYVREIAMPYAAAHGLTLVELQRKDKHGQPVTIYGKLLSRERSIDIPVRMANGAPGRRSCTGDFKVKVTAKYAWQHGARHNHPAVMQVGISWDERLRQRNDSGLSYITLAYPLVDMRITRQDCMNVIRDAGLLVPPKSSCWFCPFHTLPVWQRMRDTEPDLFQKAVDLERLINVRRARIGRDAAYLTRFARPLDRVVGDAARATLFDEPEETYSCGAFACHVA